jgi:hypothetical protein
MEPPLDIADMAILWMFQVVCGAPTVWGRMTLVMWIHWH